VQFRGGSGQANNTLTSGRSPIPSRLNFRATDMPNTKSAAKAARQSERRNVRNRSLKSRFKTFEKKFLKLLETGKADEAAAALSQATAAYAKAAKSGVIKKGKASRKQSRLQIRLNAARAKKA